MSLHSFFFSSFFSSFAPGSPQYLLPDFDLRGPFLIKFVVRSQHSSALGACLWQDLDGEGFSFSFFFESFSFVAFSFSLSFASFSFFVFSFSLSFESFSFVAFSFFFSFESFSFFVFSFSASPM